MIVRILGQGRYDVPDGDLPAIEKLDEQLNQSLEEGAEQQFAATLAALVRRIEEVGALIPADDLRPSALVVPHDGSTLDEVKALLAEG